jgi:hypothetical protein
VSPGIDAAQRRVTRAFLRGSTVTKLRRGNPDWHRTKGAVIPDLGETCRGNLVDQMQAHRLSHRVRAVVDAKL